MNPIKVKELLLNYFEDGKPKRPSDMEDDLLGGPNFMAILMLRSPFHDSIWFKPFKELVAEGKIRATQDENGCWSYQLKGDSHD